MGGQLGRHIYLPPVAGVANLNTVQVSRVAEEDFLGAGAEARVLAASRGRTVCGMAALRPVARSADGRCAPAIVEVGATVLVRIASLRDGRARAGQGGRLAAWPPPLLLLLARPVQVGAPPLAGRRRLGRHAESAGQLVGQPARTVSAAPATGGLQVTLAAAKLDVDGRLQRASPVMLAPLFRFHLSLQVAPSLHVGLHSLTRSLAIGAQTPTASASARTRAAKPTALVPTQNSNSRWLAQPSAAEALPPPPPPINNARLTAQTTAAQLSRFALSLPCGFVHCALALLQLPAALIPLATSRACQLARPLSANAPLELPQSYSTYALVCCPRHSLLLLAPLCFALARLAWCRKFPTCPAASSFVVRWRDSCQYLAAAAAALQKWRACLACCSAAAAAAALLPLSLLLPWSRLCNARSRRASPAPATRWARQPEVNEREWCSLEQRKRAATGERALAKSLAEARESN